MQEEVRKFIFSKMVLFMDTYIYESSKYGFWSMNLDPLLLFQGITGTLSGKI